MSKTVTSIILIFLCFNIALAQKNVINNPDLKKELSVRLLYDTIKNNNVDINTTKTNKSPAVSLLLSLLLPGAGHWYADRLDVGQYFFVSEAACWLGVLGFNLYGNSLRDDSRTFAAVHAGLNKSGKDDNYFSNVGNYNTIYDYNNDKLSKGQYDQLYDVNTSFWSWDNSSDMSSFESQRKKSERVYNDRIIFATGLIVNRIVSGISAFLITNKGNKKESGSIRINSELLRNNRNGYDGLKLNFVKTF